MRVLEGLEKTDKTKAAAALLSKLTTSGSVMVVSDTKSVDEPLDTTKMQPISADGVKSASIPSVSSVVS